MFQAYLLVLKPPLLRAHRIHFSQQQSDYLVQQYETMEDDDNKPYGELAEESAQKLGVSPARVKCDPTPHASTQLGSCSPDTKCCT
jgi:hypothetical protein